MNKSIAYSNSAWFSRYFTLDDNGLTAQGSDAKDVGALLVITVIRFWSPDYALG